MIYLGYKNGRVKVFADSTAAFEDGRHITVSEAERDGLPIVLPNRTWAVAHIAGDDDSKMAAALKTLETIESFVPLF